jgi:hypothetical protein
MLSIITENAIFLNTERKSIWIGPMNRSQKKSYEVVILINERQPYQSFNGAYIAPGVIITLAAVLQAGWRADGVTFTFLHRDHSGSEQSESDVE